MNKAEIKEVIDLVRAAAVPCEWSDLLSKQAALALRPLPYEWALDNATRWSMLTAVDNQGRKIPKYCNTLPEVLEAVGVPMGARGDLARASRTPGAEMMVSLRSVNELVYVGPTDPIPQGAYEYLRERGLPTPSRPVLAALSAPGPSSAAGEGMTASQVLARVRGALTRPPAPATPTPLVEVRDVLGLIEHNPQVPEAFAQALRRLMHHVSAQTEGYVAAEEWRREQVADLEEAFLGADPSLEGLLDGLTRLVERLRRRFPEAGPLALETIARALLPGLSEITISVIRQDKRNPASPMERVVVDWRRPTAPEVAPEPTRTTIAAPTRGTSRSIGDVLRG